MGRGGEGGGGGGVGRRGEIKRVRKKTKGSTFKVWVRISKGYFLCKEKARTKSYLIRYSGQKLAFRFFKLGKETKKRKLFFFFVVVTLGESS
jgi:hypothetical protein